MKKIIFNGKTDTSDMNYHVYNVCSNNEDFFCFDTFSWFETDFHLIKVGISWGYWLDLEIRTKGLSQ